MSHLEPSAGEGPQLRTLLLTDLVDSTGLIERLGDVQAAALFRQHDRLVLELQQQWRGRLIDRSDGLLLLFERPVDGLGFALDYTRGLQRMGQERGIELQARAGLHVGEVLTWKNSDAAVQVGAKPLEVEGLAKPMAARLMSLARPGQILLSAVAESLTHRADRELGERGQNLLWKSHGRWRFKGVPEAQEVFEVGEIGIAPLRPPGNAAKAWRDTPLWRRPAMLAAEVLLVAGLGISAWFLTKPQPAIAFSERDWVVVADLRNLTDEKILDDSLAQAFRISLEQSRYVNVLSEMKTRDTLSRMQRKPGTVLDRAIASEIAIRDGARAVILPTVSEVGGRLRVSAEVIDPHTQTTVYAESADGSGADSALASIDKVTAALREKLGEAMASIQENSQPLPKVTTSNLDALRAYALAQKEFGKSRYKEAKLMYARATELDPGFALAYLGLLRSHNATIDLEGGLAYLAKVQSLRADLPPRDQLYLDAWTAEVFEPKSALEKWRQMAALYPDFFQASANTGYKLHESNRFAEGLEYAQSAASAKYEQAALAFDLVGRLALAQEKYADATKAFNASLERGAKTSAIRLANTYAAQRSFDEAMRLWPGEKEVTTDYFDRVSILLDSGAWKPAKDEAADLGKAMDADSMRSRVAFFPLAVAEWMQGNDRQALHALGSMVEQTLDSIDAGANQADATDQAYAAISAGILAQRIGDHRLPGEVVRRMQGHQALLESEPTGDLYKVLLANSFLASGKQKQAVHLLEEISDGSEPFQAHAALMEAYAADSQLDKALAQAQWLGKSRGRAYSEIGCGWCQQSLNVVDTSLANLRAAELLASAGRINEARRSLELFDKGWDSSSLPNHLRVRRESVLGAFN